METQDGTTRGLRPDRVALLVLLGVALWLAYKVVRSYLDPIVIAIVIGTLVQPLQRRLTKAFRNRPTLAAVVSVVLVLLVILGPVAFLAIGLVNQAAESGQAIQEYVHGGQLDALMQSPQVRDLQERIGKLLPLLGSEQLDLKGRLAAMGGTVANFVVEKGTALLGRTGSFFTNLVLMLFVLFFVLRDGRELWDAVTHLSPLRESQERLLVERFRTVSRSAIVGAFGTALAQGIAGGVGLALVGLPGLFWGAVMAFASLVPFVGTALIWVPATAFLYLTGHPGKALFLLAWCAVLIGSIDNFLRPMLARGEGELGTLWIFFAILGGLELWGLAGLIYGPLVFGLCAALLSLYRTEFAGTLHDDDVT